MTASNVRSIAVEYNLSISPEALTRKSDFSGSSTDASNVVHTFPITATSASSSSYYAGLSRSVQKAISEMGADLTEWRDAVGDGEKDKEPTGAKQSSDDDEDDEKEEDEEPPST